MYTSQGHSLIEVIATVVFVAVIGAIGYLWLDRHWAVNQASSSSHSSSPVADSTANWKSFVSQACGFSLRYPPDMTFVARDQLHSGTCEMNFFSLYLSRPRPTSLPAVEGKSLGMDFYATTQEGAQSLPELFHQRANSGEHPLDLETVKSYDIGDIHGYYYNVNGGPAGYKTFAFPLKHNAVHLYVDDYMNPYQSSDPDTSVRIIQTMRPVP